MSDKTQQPVIPGAGTEKKYTERDIHRAQEEARDALVSQTVSVQVDVSFSGAGSVPPRSPHVIITIRGGDPEKLFAFGQEIGALALATAPSLRRDLAAES